MEGIGHGTVMLECNASILNIGDWISEGFLDSTLPMLLDRYNELHIAAFRRVKKLLFGCLASQNVVLFFFFSILMKTKAQRRKPFFRTYPNYSALT